MGRTAEVSRKTKETDVTVFLDLDGRGKYEIDTGIPFFDHMLSLMCRHGRFDGRIRAKGDIEVDYHHTVEDVGLSFGQALVKALGDKKGIRRFGLALIPMDEALAEVAVDLSGRPYLVFNISSSTQRVGNFDRELVNQFFQALAASAQLTLHVNLRYGDNLHHIIEAVFKAFGQALSMAVAPVAGSSDVPSTKGVL